MKPEAVVPGRSPGDAPVSRARRTDGPGGFCPVCWEALDLSGKLLVEDWDQLSEDAVSVQEVRDLVDALGGAVRAAAGAEVEVAALPPTALARRIVVVLRRMFLRAVRESGRSPAPGDLLRILSAFETVELELEPDWSQHLANRLSGPDGLEMVVEVAHDLRSPITSILFLAETLQQGRSGPVTDIQERQLGLIYSAAFGLSAMASDVLELARGGDRLVDLDPIPFSVTDILESVRDIVQPIAEEKGLSVEINQSAADFRVGHPVALSRVLLNLTTNALKFTDEGKVSICSTELDSGEVEFAVSDTGRGIPPHAMRTLYEPFRRRQSEGEYSFSGSGLGLSICRKLVEAMGSSLEVETTKDEGTRFFFRLDLPFPPHRP